MYLIFSREDCSTYYVLPRGTQHSDILNPALTCRLHPTRILLGDVVMLRCYEGVCKIGCPDHSRHKLIREAQALRSNLVAAPPRRRVEGTGDSSVRPRHLRNLEGGEREV